MKSIHEHINEAIQPISEASEFNAKDIQYQMEMDAESSITEVSVKKDGITFIGKHGSYTEKGINDTLKKLYPDYSFKLVSVEPGFSRKYKYTVNVVK